MNKKEFFNKLFTDYKLVKQDDAFISKNYAIITRSGIEKRQAKNNIIVDFEIIKAEPEFAVVKAISEQKERQIQTFGSAKWSDYTVVKKKNRDGKEYETKQLLQGNTNSWYVVELAEKRALARIVLKVMGWYQNGAFGEDEGVHLNQDNE